VSLAPSQKLAGNLLAKLGITAHILTSAMVLGHTGAVAFSRTGDPATGDFSDATVLRKFGDVPDDLSAL
jgi:hypothetical protein